MLLNAGILSLLVVRSHRPDARLAGRLFLVNALVVIAALWFSNEACAESGRPWVPFQANKLGMFTVALLAPEPRVGVLGIAAYAGASLLQLATLSSAALGRLALGEPWATVAIAAFAAVMLVFWSRRDARERRLSRAYEEARARERVARVLLEIRDLANTPLQTISLSTALLRRQKPELQSVLGRVDRALQKLSELDTITRRYEEHLVWPQSTPRSESSEEGSRGASREVAHPWRSKSTTS
jgi:hypothetical protein